MKIKISRVNEIIKEEFQRLSENEEQELNGLTGKVIWATADKLGNALSAEVDELLMYLQSDGDLYRQNHVPILKNLKRKADKGNFDIKLASKLFMYLVDNAAKKYVKDFGGDVKSMFPKKDRMKLAEYLAYDWAGNYINGEYDN